MTLNSGLNSQVDGGHLPRVKKTEGREGLKECSGQGGHSQSKVAINPVPASTLPYYVAPCWWGALWELRQLQTVLSSAADHLSYPSSPAGPTDRARGSGMDTNYTRGSAFS